MCANIFKHQHQHCAKYCAHLFGGCFTYLGQNPIKMSCWFHFPNQETEGLNILLQTTLLLETEAKMQAQVYPISRSFIFSTIFLFETITQGCPASSVKVTSASLQPWCPSSVPGKVTSLNDSAPSLLEPKSHSNKSVFLSICSCGPGLHLEK